MARESASSADKQSAAMASGIKSRRRRGAAIQDAALDAEVSKHKAEQSGVEDEGIADATIPDETPTLQDRVAAFIETVEIQAALVALTAFDLCLTTGSLLIRAHFEISRLQSLVERSNSAAANKHRGTNEFDSAVSDGSRPPAIASIVLRLLDSLAGFTIVIFVLELAILALVFHRQFFSHLGYVLDVLVVGLSITIEIYSGSSAARLLGVFRVWRAVRLVSTLLENEQREHDGTLEALEAEKTRVLQLQVENQAAETSLQREFKSRAGIERMLQGYKDEADTLREALTIAATAVAEATLGAISEEVEGTDASKDEVAAASQVMSGESRLHDDGLNTIEPNPTGERTPPGWEAQTDDSWDEDGLTNLGKHVQVHVEWKTQATSPRAQTLVDDEGEFADALGD